ncbi:MAG TPA: efflux RND transporter periplasmic adaptor subunit [Pirellulales bacterium]|nr:efflux RND transporter periplasmic adaptor subunit [Pirellulales bacterium]
MIGPAMRTATTQEVSEARGTSAGPAVVAASQAAATQSGPSFGPEAHAVEKAAISRKKLARVVLLLLVAGFAATGALTWPWPFVHERKPASELVLYGNVDIRQVQLAFNGNDRIAAMHVVEGDRVRQGQLLATLDARRLKAAAERTAAQVEAQRQVVARLKAGTRSEEIRKARADVQLSEADLKNAKRTYGRWGSLAESKSASQQEADVAETAAEVAALLDLAVAGPRKEDIAEASATLKNFEAQLVLAETELADCSLYAPSDGTVEDRILEPGDMASPQKSVYTLALSDPVWVRAYLSEPDLGKISLGMAAEVETDSYPGKRYRGWIGFIAPTAEFTPKSVEVRQLRTRLVYQVRVFVKNPRDELRLGMPVTVYVPLDQPRPAEGWAERKAAE